MMTHISGYFIHPEMDEQGNVIGCTGDYVTNVELGGNIPTSIINTFLPRSAQDGVEGLVKHISNEFKNK